MYVLTAVKLVFVSARRKFVTEPPICMAPYTVGLLAMLTVVRTGELVRRTDMLVADAEYGMKRNGSGAEAVFIGELSRLICTLLCAADPARYSIQALGMVIGVLTALNEKPLSVPETTTSNRVFETVTALLMTVTAMPAAVVALRSSTRSVVAMLHSEKLIEMFRKELASQYTPMPPVTFVREKTRTMFDSVLGVSHCRHRFIVVPLTLMRKLSTTKLAPLFDSEKQVVPCPHASELPVIVRAVLFTNREKEKISRSRSPANATLVMVSCRFTNDVALLNKNP
jgi:hypothetical protein